MLLAVIVKPFFRKVDRVSSFIMNVIFSQVY
jgi:hypothetical protein